MPPGTYRRVLQPLIGGGLDNLNAPKLAGFLFEYAGNTWRGSPLQYMVDLPALQYAPNQHFLEALIIADV